MNCFRSFVAAMPVTIMSTLPDCTAGISAMNLILENSTGLWSFDAMIRASSRWMFGAMIGSSVLHGTGLIEGGLPPWVRAVALVGIGALIGSRFARMNAKTLLSHVNSALGSFAIAIAISAVFVAVIALTTHVRFADIIVAFAPGAMDAMLALALTLHIDPIFVGAHHLSRFVFVTITTPGIVHLFGRPQEDVDD